MESVHVMIARSAKLAYGPRLILSAGTVILFLFLTEGAFRGYYAVTGRPTDSAPPSTEAEYRNRWLEWHRDGKEDLFYGFVQYDQELGWAPRPNFSQQDAAHRPVITLNSRGARCLRDIPHERSAGRKRIVAVGDSFTFGFGSADDEIWPALLERELQNCEVVNLGVVGYGGDQQALFLEREGIRYLPDVVLVGFYEDDADRNLAAFRDFAKPQFVLERGELKLTHVPVPSPQEVLAGQTYRPPASYALDYFERRWRRRTVEFGSNNAHLQTRREDLARALLARMSKTAEGSGAKMLVVFIPLDVDHIFTEGNLPAEMSQWATEDGYAFLDLAPAFLDAMQKKGRSPYSGHFNRLGHFLAAEAIRGKLTALHWAIPAQPETLTQMLDEVGEEKDKKPMNLADHLRRGDLLYNQNRLEEALIEYDKALTLKPDFPEIHNNTALTLERLGRSDEAKAHYLQALRLKPDYAEAENNLGALLAGQGKTGEAVAHFQSALRIKPDYAEARQNLTQALNDGQSKP